MNNVTWFVSGWLCGGLFSLMQAVRTIGRWHARRRSMKAHPTFMGILDKSDLG